MKELKKEELEKGKKAIEGPMIYFWVIAVIVGISLFSLNFGDWMRSIHIGPIEIGLPSQNSSFLFLGLYVAALVGLYIRKGWAVPVGRAGLVVSMVVFFPVGTIFGAILWKRFNDPLAKKYLNYEIKEETNETNLSGNGNENQKNN